MRSGIEFWVLFLIELTVTLAGFSLGRYTNLIWLSAEIFCAYLLVFIISLKILSKRALWLTLLVPVALFYPGVFSYLYAVCAIAKNCM
jgi:hypothetical protein